MEIDLGGETRQGTLQAAGEVGVDQRLRRRGRMDIDGGLQGLGGGEDVPVFRIVKIFTVGVGVDDHALHAQGPAPLYLLCRTGRGLGRDDGHAREAIGMAAARLGQLIVGGDRQGAACFRVKHLHPRGRQHQQLFVDPHGIHVPDPPLSQVL